MTDNSLSSVYTKNIPNILKAYNGCIMTTTYQSGQLIILRPINDELNTHFVNFNHPMGLVANRQRLTLGTNLEIIDFFNIPELKKNKDISPNVDSVYAIRNSHITGYIDIHEMAYTDNGELWFANTLFSCLCSFDMQNSFVPQWKPKFISQYAPQDRCHLNGLGLREGAVRYVTALGATDTKEGWRENKKIGGIIIDIQNDEIISTGLSMPHSPRWWNGRLYVLESGSGSLCTVDLNSGKKTTVAKVPGFCRGLDFIGNLAFVGLSQLRDTTPINDIQLVEENKERFSGIWVINLTTGQTEGFVKFTGQVEEIFSLQFVQNVLFPEIIKEGAILKQCYAIPEEAFRNSVA